MERLIHGRTSFMIAHRLSTLENCDLLLVLDDGQLVDVTLDVLAAVKYALTSGGLEAVIQGRAGQ
jgi:ABC-type bacteriocin/lantibiotic exporter with double-glycine peptidase domain